RELRALGRRGDAEVWRDRLNRLYLQMEESPVPHEEWRHLLTRFDADQLGSLLGISGSSLHRYAGGERATPDDVAARLHFLALIVGDLAGSYNEIGLRRWFQRKRTALDGRSPAAIFHGQWLPESQDCQRVKALAASLVSSPAT
ncbi:MAG: hypothetical protein ACYDAG_19400, partial [Chloroflexota bacterium]